MKVPLSWLKAYIHLEQSPEEIALALTSMGLEVEGVEKRHLSFEGVAVAKVIDVKPHPNADRLRIATVFDGHEHLQIVCGAANCRPGIKTALAKIGALLTDKDGKKITIKKGKLRDVESYGMLCAADELGLTENSLDGILELDQAIPEGTDLRTLYSDIIFDISLTPNLGHDLSIIGVARELSAKFVQPLHFPPSKVTDDPDQSIESVAKIEIKTPELCIRYACRFIRGVRVGPSPEWLKVRLEAAGQKSINNLVDIGNFVMLETGQPLHFFDADKIEKHHIIVDQAKNGGSFDLLDGTSCQIPDGTLLIQDPTKPLAIAGVMGGQSSAISESTVNVLIESASFNPTSIRKTSKLLGLQTEAAYRFERGTDPEMVFSALERAASLTLEVAGGVALKGILQYAPPIPLRQLVCRVSRLNSFLGLSLSQNEIAELFQRLFMKVVLKNTDLLDVTIPSFRNDLQIEEDLFEEAARLYGYNHIPRSKVKHVVSPFGDAPLFLFEKEVRAKLLQEGLQECINCDLISPTEARLTLERGLDEHSLVRVLRPSSIDQSILRPSLLPGMLKIARFNQDHGTTDLSLFEIGKIHFREKTLYKEQLLCALVLKGKVSPYYHSPKVRSADFFDLKGTVENLFANLKVPRILFESSHFHSLHPFQQAKIVVGGVTIGSIGQIHPEILLLLDIKDPLFFAEIDLQQLSTFVPKVWQSSPIPPFPGSERDWTITLKESLPVDELFTTIRQISSPFLKDVFLLDVYQSDQLGSHKKNVTLRFFYIDKERTIEQAIVDREHAKLKEQVAEKLSNYVL
jgi:phenylalanyl-tRNA synthetase beta chain